MFRLGRVAFLQAEKIRIDRLQSLREQVNRNVPAGIDSPGCGLVRPVSAAPDQTDFQLVARDNFSCQ
jgi:hypothetical protein